MTSPTARKRAQLTAFTAQKLAGHAAVRAVLAIGSLASGTAHDGSDLDVAIFLDPFDPYLVPAESIWDPESDTFHSIFVDDDRLQRHGLPLDCQRFDLARWRDPAHHWPEPVRAELAGGWTAFDRDGEVTRLVAERAVYVETYRQQRLDEAITWLDQHLAEQGLRTRWTTLGPATAQDRLQAAYEYLVQALFAANRRWRPWRNREMTALLALPWLPANFADRVLAAAVASGHGETAYLARACGLQRLFDELLQHLRADGTYGDDPISEAFIRSHHEPGRAWNMDAWNAEHRRRFG